MNFGIGLISMPERGLAIPPADAIRQHLLNALSRYWPSGQDALVALPVRKQPAVSCDLPLRLVSVLLPDWGSVYGVEGAILVPQEALPGGGDWRQVDWWQAAFLLLEGWHERLWEEKYGPIHSYSFRLKGWDERVWQHAWVNRIALFLRAWAAESAGVPAEHLFGSLPQPEFLMTHDVDAIAKTLPIRIKQGGFNFVNACRAMVTGDFQAALSRLGQACRFLFGREDWWTLDKLLDMEIGNQLHARYHFYADHHPKTIKRWLFDPSYDIANTRVRWFLQRLAQHGGEIGLHPCFDSWQAGEQILQQKTNLEAVAERQCRSCRQHWLRFSWRDTWAAQEKAGLREDTTLMFNDRPGFRNSAAIAWRPWLAAKGSAGQLTAMPTIIMDSHFYDYQPMADEERRQTMRRWVNECREVYGQNAVLWHPHTLTEDYGWGRGFAELVSFVAGGH